MANKFLIMLITQLVKYYTLDLEYRIEMHLLLSYPYLNVQIINESFNLT